MKEKTRRFLGIWIPREIWLNDSLTLVEKAMLVEIESLDNADGCWAGNQYFADFFKVSPRMIKNYVASLRDKNFIDVELIGRTKRVIRMKEGMFPREGKKLPSSEGKKLHHNNTESNNTFNKEDSNGQAVAELLHQFDEVNPAIKRMYGNKTQRSAAERLIKKFGFEGAIKAAQFAVKVLGVKFAPRITTPYELETSWAKLVAFAHENKPKNNILI